MPEHALLAQIDPGDKRTMAQLHALLKREGLLNQLVSHLAARQAERGVTHLFLYTKCESAKYFSDLGFYENARVDGAVSFLEN